jgi:phenylpropionate dioxygenase-like ring-hydroxylating dioxygenase large terminal subunit
MLVTEQPILRRFWYPVMPMSSLGDGPQPFTLMGQPLVIWLDAKGYPAAAEDRCCHRTAQLSLGEVIDGSIRCPYHGWQFNREGQCMKVPQLRQEMIPRTYRIRSFRCQECYGYVWVCLEEPLQAIPTLPEVEDPQFRQIQQFNEVWRCSGLRLMENSFDNAHPQFVHAQTFGLQQDPLPPQLDSFEELDYGLRITYRLPVFNTELQKRNLAMSEDRTVRISEGTWFMPFARKLKITYPNGLIHIIFTAATPIDDRSSQILQFCLRNDTEAATKAEEITAFDRLITWEDQRILESTDYDTPLDIHEEQHMATDKPGIVMRLKLAALLRDHGEIEQRRGGANTVTPAEVAQMDSLDP